MAESGTPSENEKKKNADAMVLVVLVVRACLRPTNDQQGC